MLPLDFVIGFAGVAVVVLVAAGVGDRSIVVTRRTPAPPIR